MNLPPDFDRWTKIQQWAWYASYLGRGLGRTDSYWEFLTHAVEGPASSKLVPLLMDLVEARAGRRFQLGSSGRFTHEEDVLITETCYSMATWAFWGQAGFNTFELTESLTAMLMLTDARLKYDDIHWPFPSFMLQLPPGFLPGFESEAAYVKVSHLYHSFRQQLQPGVRPTEEPYLRVEVYRTGFTPVVSINRSIAELGEQKLSEIWNYGAGGVVEVTENDVAQILLPLVCNFALWITATNFNDAQKRKRPKRKKRQRDSRVWPSLWLVGRDVKIPAEMRAAAKRGATGTGGPQVSRPLDHQVVVRGHFKRQAHGPGHSLRKVIFVAPYVRGPEDAAAWAHQYKLLK